MNENQENPDVSGTRFRIVFQDGSYVDSHDENWVQQLDHAHVLLPYNNKQWLEYQLHRPDDFFVAVNFNTGAFNFNGQIIHPGSEDGEILTNLDGKQSFDVSEQWQLLNGLCYFPVVGRRQFKGFDINLTVPFCGWKRKIGERTVSKVAYLYPDGHVVLT